eukprot:1710070-Amphidinium_carterae.3
MDNPFMDEQRMKSSAYHDHWKKNRKRLKQRRGNCVHPLLDESPYQEAGANKKGNGPFALVGTKHEPVDAAWQEWF